MKNQGIQIEILDVDDSQQLMKKKFIKQNKNSVKMRGSPKLNHA